MSLSTETQFIQAVDEQLQRIAEKSQIHSFRLATAESCTGGWVGKMLTDFPGSSAWFEAGLIVYSNHAKARLLNVPEELIDQQGAVSEPVARAMVSGCLAATGADMAVAITGIAGPSGGSIEEPVGMIWLAWQAEGQQAMTKCCQFEGTREQVRLQSVLEAIHGLNQLVESV